MPRSRANNSPRYVSEWAALVPSVERAERLVREVSDAGVDLDHFVEALVFAHKGNFEVMGWELHLAGLGGETWKGEG